MKALKPGLFRKTRSVADVINGVKRNIFNIHSLHQKVAYFLQKFWIFIKKIMKISWIMITPQKILTFNSSHSSANRSLSSCGEPLWTGYSQSRSNPSNPYFLKYLIVFWMNSDLEALLWTIVVKVALPWVPPPTARVT